MAKKTSLKLDIRIDSLTNSIRNVASGENFDTDVLQADIDLIVEPMPLSDEDRQAISSIIAHYKTTLNKILWRTASIVSK